jgi:plasmid stability protein
MEKTITLPDELNSALRDAADRSGQSEDEIVREALDAYLRRLNPPASRRPMPRSIGIASNLGIQASEVDAWLEANWHPD